MARVYVSSTIADLTEEREAVLKWLRRAEHLAIESYVHLFSDHTKAAMRCGWQLEAMDEGVIDDAWIAKKPRWERFRHHPVSFVLVWRRGPEISARAPRRSS